MADAPLATLESIQKRVLWLAALMVHHANSVRPNADGTKVGGHQASSSSVVGLMTALYFHALRPGDIVATKAHASPIPCNAGSAIASHTLPSSSSASPASATNRGRGPSAGSKCDRTYRRVAAANSGATTPSPTDPVEK